MFQKYEFCLSLHEPKIVWAEGPVVPSYADISMFRGGKSDEDVEEWDKSALYFQIPEGKRVIADGGYAGEPTKITISSNEHPAAMKKFIADAKARQETFHTRLKFFKILGNRFRHGKNTAEKMKLHKMAVDICCIIVQYDYENGNPPFELNIFT